MESLAFNICCCLEYFRVSLCCSWEYSLFSSFLDWNRKHGGTVWTDFSFSMWWRVVFQKNLGQTCNGVCHGCCTAGTFCGDVHNKSTYGYLWRFFYVIRSLRCKNNMKARKNSCLKKVYLKCNLCFLTQL